MKSICPWITRNSNMNAYRKRIKGKILYICTSAEYSNEESATSAEENGLITVPTIETTIAPHRGTEIVIYIHKQGRRPKGSTKKRKHIEELACITTKNEILIDYEEEMIENKRLNKRTRRGRLLEIIDAIKPKNNS